MPVIMAPDGTMAKAPTRGSVSRRSSFRRSSKPAIHCQSHSERSAANQSRATPAPDSSWLSMRNVVEPRLSDQCCEDQPLQNLPFSGAGWDDPYFAGAVEAVYVNWLENIRDWNISRQLCGTPHSFWYCDKLQRDDRLRTDVTLVSNAADLCPGRGRARHVVLSQAVPHLHARWPDRTQRHSPRSTPPTI